MNSSGYAKSYGPVATYRRNAIFVRIDLLLGHHIACLRVAATDAPQRSPILTNHLNQISRNLFQALQGEANPIIFTKYSEISNPVQSLSGLP
jgi:hypothetical protein